MSTRGDRVKEGYLKKLPPLSRNPSRREFKLRWFVLWESCHLAYYNKKDGELIKEINLMTCSSVEPNYRKAGVIREREYALFLRTPDREWVFLADNQDEMQSWVDAIQRIVRVGKGDEPPPVQPRPLDTLPRSPTPEQERQQPASPARHSHTLGRPLPGSPLLQGSGLGMHRIDADSSIATRPLPQPPSSRPYSTSQPAEPRLTSPPHGYQMAGHSSTLPSQGRGGGHHDYINADTELQRPTFMSSQSPYAPHFGAPLPPSQSFTSPTSPVLPDRGSYSPGYQDRPQLDDHYVSFQREQSRGMGMSQNIQGYVPMKSVDQRERHFMPNMGGGPPRLMDRRVSADEYVPSKSGNYSGMGGMQFDASQMAQWKSFGDEPVSKHSYVNMSGDQVTPQLPPRSHGH